MAVEEALAAPSVAGVLAGVVVSVAVVADSADGWRRRRRARQLPRLQSRPASRLHRLERNQLHLSTLCRSPCRVSRRCSRPTEQSFTLFIHERALYPAPHQAQRQRHGLPHALRHTLNPPPTISTPTFPPTRSGAAIFPLLGCQQSTIPPHPANAVSRQRQPWAFPTVRPTSYRSIASPPGRSFDALPSSVQWRAPYPEPNLPAGSSLNNNYHLLTTGQSNTTERRHPLQPQPRRQRHAARWPRRIAAEAEGAVGRRTRAFARASTSTTTRSHSASDLVNLIPQLDGKSASDSYSLQAGYTVGYHRVTNIFNSSWNRATATPSTSSPIPPSIPPDSTASTCPTTFPSTTACPTSRSATASRASAKRSPASPSRKPSRSPRS